MRISTWVIDVIQYQIICITYSINILYPWRVLYYSTSSILRCLNFTPFYYFPLSIYLSPLVVCCVSWMPQITIVFRSASSGPVLRLIHIPKFIASQDLPNLTTVPWAGGYPTSILLGTPGNRWIPPSTIFPSDNSYQRVTSAASAPTFCPIQLTTLNKVVVDMHKYNHPGKIVRLE